MCACKSNTIEGIKNLLNNSTRFLIKSGGLRGYISFCPAALYTFPFVKEQQLYQKKKKKFWLGLVLRLLLFQKKIVWFQGISDKQIFLPIHWVFIVVLARIMVRKQQLSFFAQWTNGEFAPFYFCKLTRTFQVKPSLATKSRGQIP